MFSAIEVYFSIDDELSALLADNVAFVGDGSATIVDPSDAGLAPVVAGDSLVVVDPMMPADSVVFTGATDPTVVAPSDPAPLDPAAGDAVLPGPDVLLLVDDSGFDLDLSILDIGRALGQFGFNDLP